ncbi:MAG: NAD(P)H dehydrogenase (quinone) [Bacteroidetes bacterium 38_7]|nr:MAG: NAD(P)H dehydrogenase (quinone) [Bacteroidetes bacterium 38_7]HAL64690.1 NADPH:quinone reductase [Bacteroidales bacterium]
MKNILILNGHPDKESLCSGLAQSYKRGAEATGANCKLIHLIDLHFNPILQYGYRKRMELEPDLISIQQDIIKSDHLVFVYPTWWGTYPALFKGFIDRIFLPGFSFKYHENSLRWDKLLTEKSARLIVTMDSPKWYYSIIYKSPGHNSIKRALLEFCGIRPVKTTSFSKVKLSDEKTRQHWLDKVEKLGRLQK